MTLQEIQYKAQSIIGEWRDDDSAPYIEFVEELAHMIVPEPSEGVEEAASEYSTNEADRVWGKPDPHDYTDHSGCGAAHDNYEVGLQVGFKAGAKWQKEKDEHIYRDFFDARNQGDASLLDLLAYQEGHRDGMAEQKEQMMEEAVEGQVFGATDVKALYEGKVYVVSNLVQDTDYNLYPNDKVRIIIVKED